MVETECATLTRDYFLIEDEAGLRFWIFATVSMKANSRTRRASRLKQNGSGTGCSHERAVANSLRRDRHHHQFLVPARRLGPAGLCASGQRFAHSVIGIAITNTLAGVVRAYKNSATPRQTQAKASDRRTYRLHDGTPDIFVYPRDRAAYGRLCQLLTHGKRGDDVTRIEKGEMPPQPG